MRSRHAPQRSFLDLVYDRIPPAHLLRLLQEAVDFGLASAVVAETCSQ